MSKSTLLLGAGWLGLPLGSALAESGYRVTATTTRSTKLPALRAKGLTPVVMTLSDRSHLPAAEYDWAILTIPPNRNETDSLAYADSLRPLLREVRATNWLFISTTGVYPDLLREVREDTPPDPLRTSARAMWEAERLLRSELGERLHVFRLAGLSGPAREPGRFFAGKTDVDGGDDPVNFVHQTDIVRALQVFLERPLPGALYNLCADRHPVKKVFYPERARLADLEVPTFRDGNTHWKIVDNGAFRRDYQFAYRYPDPLEFPIG